MSHVVVTSTGGVAVATVPGSSSEKLTEDSANYLAKQMNERAEALGIKTRYEVAEREVETKEDE